MIANFLTTCAAFSWVIHTNIVSIFLFGESPYPTEDQED